MTNIIFKFQTYKSWIVSSFLNNLYFNFSSSVCNLETLLLACQAFAKLDKDLLLLALKPLDSMYPSDMMNFFCYLKFTKQKYLYFLSWKNIWVEIINQTQKTEPSVCIVWVKLILLLIKHPYKVELYTQTHENLYKCPKYINTPQKIRHWWRHLVLLFYKRSQLKIVVLYLDLPKTKSLLIQYIHIQLFFQKL